MFEYIYVLMYENQSVIQPVDSEKCICKIYDSGKRLRERENKRHRERGRQRVSKVREDW